MPTLSSVLVALAMTSAAALGDASPSRFHCIYADGLSNLYMEQIGSRSVLFKCIMGTKCYQIPNKYAEIQCAYPDDKAIMSRNSVISAIDDNINTGVQHGTANDSASADSLIDPVPLSPTSSPPRLVSLQVVLPTVTITVTDDNLTATILTISSLNVQASQIEDILLGQSTTDSKQTSSCTASSSPTPTPAPTTMSLPATTLSNESTVMEIDRMAVSSLTSASSTADGESFMGPLSDRLTKIHRLSDILESILPPKNIFSPLISSVISRERASLDSFGIINSIDFERVPVIETKIIPITASNPNNEPASFDFPMDSVAPSPSWESPHLHSPLPLLPPSPPPLPSPPPSLPPPPQQPLVSPPQPPLPSAIATHAPQPSPPPRPLEPPPQQPSPSAIVTQAPPPPSPHMAVSSAAVASPKRAAPSSLPPAARVKKNPTFSDLLSAVLNHPAAKYQPVSTAPKKPPPPPPHASPSLSQPRVSVSPPAVSPQSVSAQSQPQIKLPTTLPLPLSLTILPPSPLATVQPVSSAPRPSPSPTPAPSALQTQLPPEPLTPAPAPSPALPTQQSSPDAPSQSPLSVSVTDVFAPLSTIESKGPSASDPADTSGKFSISNDFPINVSNIASAIADILKSQPAIFNAKHKYDPSRDSDAYADDSKQQIHHTPDNGVDSEKGDDNGEAVHDGRKKDTSNDPESDDDDDDDDDIDDVKDIAMPDTDLPIHRHAHRKEEQIGEDSTKPKSTRVPSKKPIRIDDPDIPD